MDRWFENASRVAVPDSGIEPHVWILAGVALIVPVFAHWLHRSREEAARRREAQSCRTICIRELEMMVETLGRRSAQLALYASNFRAANQEPRSSLTKALIREFYVSASASDEARTRYIEGFADWPSRLEVSEIRALARWASHLKSLRQAESAMDRTPEGDNFEFVIDSVQRMNELQRDLALRLKSQLESNYRLNDQWWFRRLPKKAWRKLRGRS